MAEQSSLTVASDVQIETSAGSGSGLVRATGAAAFRSEPIALSRKMTSAEALVIVAASCLRQIALNETGVRDGLGEAVHQMRVGLRRLRAALAIFQPVLQPAEFDDLKRELVWLTEQLAEARDYDVLLESKRKFDVVTSSLFAFEAELTSELSRRRQEAFLIASHAVGDVRFERIIVSAAIRLISRADADGAGGEPVRELARRALERRTRRVLRGLARFARLGERERHELRIRVKKLRYAMQFFAGVFPHSRRSRKRFSRALEALQETLGTLNDMAVQQRIATSMIDESTNEARLSRRCAFAMGGLTGYQQAELRSLLAAVPELRARLAEAPHFWNKQP